MSDTGHTYGCLAQFATEAALLAAIGGLKEAGITQFDICTPYALDEHFSTAGEHDRVVLSALAGGILGGAGTLAMEYFAAVIHYPIRVGGRPFASWPAFIPAALEMTLLFAALFGIGAMLLGNELPRFHHPLFNVQQFERASQDRLLLIVRIEDPLYDWHRLHELLLHRGAAFIAEAPR